MTRTALSLAISLAMTLTAAPAIGAAQLCQGLVVTIPGGVGDDLLVGTSEPDVIHGFGGNDIIEGLGDDDVICGGAGNDVL